MSESEKDWKLVAGIVLVVQLLIEVIALAVILWLNILPVLYTVLVVLVLVRLPMIVYHLFYPGGKNGYNGKTVFLYIRRSLGCIVSAFTMVFCILLSSMMAKAGYVMREISTTTVTDTVSAYVLDESPAETVSDAKNYVFAITENYDYDHTQTAIEKINETTETTIRTQPYSDMFAMVQALYDGRADAMILNSAYVDVIESVGEYEDFSLRTRTLFDEEIESVATDNPLLGAAQPEGWSVATDPFVVYVSGSDTRRTKLATGRSDVNILLVVNPTTKQVLMINTPRDYYVETSVSDGARDKLTHCGIYGIDCSMDTLSSLYDEEVDYYAQINFSGFETLVDAIGGITVDSEKTFRCSEGGYEIKEGTNELDGKTALSYVRERKAFADGDNARGRHQMQVIKAIIEKVSSGTTVLARYSAILQSMEGMFATNLSSDDMAALVRMQLSDRTAWNVKTFAVSGTDSSETTYSMPSERSYVMIPDEEQVSYAQELIDRVMAGEILTDADMEMH